MLDRDRTDCFFDWLLTHAYVVLAVEFVVGCLLILWKNGW